MRQTPLRRKQATFLDPRRDTSHGHIGTGKPEEHQMELVAGLYEFSKPGSECPADQSRHEREAK